MRTPSGKPIVAVSNGDPAGIGPEIVVKALADPELRAAAAPVVIGSPALYERDRALLGAPIEMRVIGSPAEARGEAGSLEIVPFDQLDASAFGYGTLTAEGGRYSGASAFESIGLAMRGQAQAAVISPNNKRAMHEAGQVQTGFEEMCRAGTGATRSIQILIGRKYRLARVTNHVPLRKVAELCTRERVLTAIHTLRDSLETLGLARPRIGVSGLNPHNGEHGLIGDEEMTDIGPACEDARAAGLDVVGPISADTVFVDFDKLGLDIILAMYHDHGNSGMKILEFGHLVNFIGGLPVPIFTVTHGTAFDLAGKGMADPTNMILSIKAAARSVRKE